ncbi:MAG: hypothetical protein ACR2K9_05255 [Solirubrobacteraceae bacterium]
MLSRLAAWLVTGPIGHLIAGLIDWGAIGRKVLWARLRGRRPEW